MTEMRRTNDGHKELHDRFTEYRVETYIDKELIKVEVFTDYEEALKAFNA